MVVLHDCGSQPDACALCAVLRGYGSQIIASVTCVHDLPDYVPDLETRLSPKVISLGT